MDISKQLNTEVDASDADFASVPALAAQAAARLGGTPLLPNADGVIVLPAGVSLDDVEVVGRDLVIRLADGQVLVIPDGAVFVPQIAVDGVVVPPLNLAALLTGNEPQPAAGTVQSSGGNFADPADPLQDAYGLGDLLPYTELAFPEQQQQEILPGLIDREPDVQIQDGGPVGRDVIDNVSEVGLPGTRANGAVESPGSAAGNGAHATTGTIFVTSPDGIAAITINGVTVTGATGQQIVTPTGVLTLGALVDGQIGYTYTLGDNTSGDATTDVFTVAITDTDGDVATARLTIEIADDVPTARDDTAEIFEGDADNAVTFDIDTNDTPGADGTGSRTFASLTGTYGTITVNADGTQTYTLTPAGLAAINALPPGSTLTDSFTYTLTDGDGDSDPATLVVTLRGTDDGVLISGLTPAAQGGDTSVDEDDLANGSDPAPKDSLAGTGTFTISAPDGVDDLNVGGFAVIANGVFQAGAGGTTPLGNTLTFTAYDAATGTVSYSYTLVASEVHASGDGENLLFENFTVTLTDVDGSSDTNTLSVRIVDDLPAASNDGPAGVVEDGTSSVSGSVLGNDASGRIPRQASLPGRPAIRRKWRSLASTARSASMPMAPGATCSTTAGLPPRR